MKAVAFNASGVCFYCCVPREQPHHSVCTAAREDRHRQSMVRESRRQAKLGRERKAESERQEVISAQALRRRRAAIEAGAPEEIVYRNALLFALRANGFTYREIADRLGVSVGTVKHTDQLIMERIAIRFQAMVDGAEFRSTLKRTAVKSWRQFDSMMAL